MNRTERLAADGAVDPVLFYGARESYGCFSNFSRHPVVLPHPWTLEPVTYLTSEHRYQAMKAVTAEDHDYVAAADHPTEAKFRGGATGITLRADWGNTQRSVCCLVMTEVLTAKFLQHPDFRNTLSKTADRWIYEDSPTDDIWGWRYQEIHNGKNLLGLALMYVRSLLC